MITQFKIFENINEGEPTIGDYVICEESSLAGQFVLNTELSTLIGKIINDQNINTYRKLKYRYRVIFEDTIDKWERSFSKDEIKYWSKNKEELKVILASKNSMYDNSI